MKKIFEYVLEVAKIVVLCLVIILPIRYLVMQPFYVKGASMEPTYQDHNYLMVDEISYRFKEPQRGDVVVFRYPHDPQEYFIKRLIGLPGETISFANGKVFITSVDGETKQLDESYLPAGTETYSIVDDKVSIPAGEYFFMGDNRSGSKDSRSFGPVKKTFIIGRVFFRGWPLTELEATKRPVYNF